MKTRTITMNLLSALLLCAGAVQAAEPQTTATKRPLDLSVPQDATSLQAWRKKQELERQNRKPYGSGYESRGLGEHNNSAADEMPVPSNPAAGNGTADGGRAGGGGAGGGGAGSGGGSGSGSGGSSGGGSGGAGGRGR